MNKTISSNYDLDIDVLSNVVYNQMKWVFMNYSFFTWFCMDCTCFGSLQKKK